MSLSIPLVTTAPALAEAMYLIGARAGGWPAQERLWILILRGDLEVVDLDSSMLRRARDLMEKYRDLPMDLADATLVAVAEARGVRRVFTLNADFRVYRFRGRQAFEIIP
jgi:uncharacterized protein